MISRFLSPTVQGELSNQPCRQPPCSTLGYPIQLTYLFNQAFLSISGYLIQSTYLFNQAFLSTSDHFSGSIGDPKGLLDNLVGPRPSGSSTLHEAS